MTPVSVWASPGERGGTNGGGLEAVRLSDVFPVLTKADCCESNVVVVVTDHRKLLTGRCSSGSSPLIAICHRCVASSRSGFSGSSVVNVGFFSN